MNGAALSRWTMSYFAAALLSLLAAEATMSAGFGFPAEAIRAPATLVVVHLVTIGWLSLTMCGALGQFIPVLTERPLHSDQLPLPALALLASGMAALILGFLRLDGRVPMELPFLSVAALLLGTGFALVTGISRARCGAHVRWPCQPGSWRWDLRRSALPQRSG